LEENKSKWLWKQMYMNEMLTLYKEYSEKDITLCDQHVNFKSQLQSRII
jgi:hypothetical protein